MQVRLTQSGRKALGWSPDRIIASVSDKRAYAMMKNGMANPDKGFMAMFNGPLPEKAKPEPKEVKEEVKVVAKKEEPKKEQPKREKADSKKFGKRSKAVKY